MPPNPSGNIKGCQRSLSIAMGIFLLSFGFPILSALAEESLAVSVPVDPGATIDQHLYRERPVACGPTALANSLCFGTVPMRNTWAGFVGGDDATRLRFLIDRWFLNRNSVVFPKQKRMSFDGVLEEDLAIACNELLKDHGIAPFSSGFLDREPDEKSPAFVRRIQESITDSLEAGVPPVISLKTFVARRLERMDDEVAWEMASHHWLAITSASRHIRIADLGFTVDFIDPNGGHVTRGFIYAENRLNFRALKGAEESGVWLDGRPFLLVQAPGVLSVRPKDAEWKDRVVVIANYLVGKY